MSLAVYNIARSKVRKLEGGYNKGFTGSGETYRGIDRLYNKSWPGWAIIDTIPNKKLNQFFNNPALEKSVDDWHYTKYWIPSRAAELSNEDLSIFYFDFYFHKPLQARVAMNTAAKEINPSVKTNEARLTDEVLAVANANPFRVYERVWALRELHYNNKWLNKGSGWSAVYTTSKRGVIARLNSFPKSLDQKKKSNNIRDAFNPDSWARNSSGLFPNK